MKILQLTYRTKVCKYVILSTFNFCGFISWCYTLILGLVKGCDIKVKRNKLRSQSESEVSFFSLAVLFVLILMWNFFVVVILLHYVSTLIFQVNFRQVPFITLFLLMRPNAYVPKSINTRVSFFCLRSFEQIQVTVYGVELTVLLLNLWLQKKKKKKQQTQTLWDWLANYGG